MVYLASYEQDKDTRNRQQKRQQEHMLGRELLDYGLRQEYALFLSERTIGKGQYGKPYLADCPDIHFSISHCDGMAACGISERTIGVDIERIRPFSERTAGRVLAEEELAEGCEITPELFFRYWTLKESYLKAIGTGLSFPMKEVVFHWDGEGNISCNCPGYAFYQTCLEERFLLAVCIRKSGEDRFGRQDIKLLRN